MASIDSVEDIAEWASYVLRVEVTGEGERNTSPLGPGEELVGRDVSVLVYEVTWAHPGAVNPVSAGETLTVYTFPGYIRSEGELRPAVEDGDTRMEVGTDYVVVMADDLDVNGEQILTLLDSFTDEDDQAVLADGTELESGPLATDPTLRDVAADAGPRRGESLVDRLERYTDEADTSRP